MPVVPPYHETKIWCLWSPLTMWPKFDSCGPPLQCDQNLMPVVPLYIWPKFDPCGPPLSFDQNLTPVVPPYHVTKIWCLWSPLTTRPKFDACGPPLPFEWNLMAVVPPYYLSKIWCLWSPLTIWAKFDDCGPPLPVAVTRTQGCSLMIWCHKNARLYIALWFDVAKTQNLMPVVPPYHLSKIWCLWSPLTIWVKFDACGPPLLFEQNLMPVVPPYQ